MLLTAVICYSDFFYCQMIKEFRDDEMEHHDTGLEHDAESVSLKNGM